MIIHNVDYMGSHKEVQCCFCEFDIGVRSLQGEGKNSGSWRTAGGSPASDRGVMLIPCPFLWAVVAWVVPSSSKILQMTYCFIHVSGFNLSNVILWASKMPQDMFIDKQISDYSWLDAVLILLLNHSKGGWFECLLDHWLNGIFHRLNGTLVPLYAFCFHM